MLALRSILALVLATTACAFMPLSPKTIGSTSVKRGGPVFAGEVEIVFPGNKKVKAAPGTALSAAATKAKFSPSYGCEEGKCGSCELKGSDGYVNLGVMEKSVVDHRQGRAAFSLLHFHNPHHAHFTTGRSTESASPRCPRLPAP